MTKREKCYITRRGGPGHLRLPGTFDYWCRGGADEMDYATDIGKHKVLCKTCLKNRAAYLASIVPASALVLASVPPETPNPQDLTDALNLSA